MRLESDVADRDKYGRLLRYIYVDDLLVNAELVRLGYAYSSSQPPNVKYQQLFLQLEREAREKEKRNPCPRAILLVVTQYLPQPLEWSRRRLFPMMKMPKLRQRLSLPDRNSSSAVRDSFSALCQRILR